LLFCLPFWGAFYCGFKFYSPYFMFGLKTYAGMGYLARYGSVCIGGVYVFVGVIAMLSLMRVVDGGADEDSVLEMLHRSWVGEILLWIILAGIVSYMAWRFFEALADPLHHGGDMKGVLKRIGIVGSSVAYGAIAWSGIQAMIGAGDPGEGFEEQRHLIDSVLHWRYGTWLIGIAGVVVGFVAIMELRFVVLGNYKPALDVDNMPKARKRLINILAWAGHFARSIILGIMAYSLLRGAVYDDASETVNTDKAFNFIGESMLGHPLFVLVAMGTVCYGVYMILFGVFMEELSEPTRARGTAGLMDPDRDRDKL